MTIGQAQKKHTLLPAMETEILLAYIINKTKEFVFAHQEFPLSLWQQLRLRYCTYLRKQGYSIAAITGHKEFYGLDFLVNKKVLIPRPDTELMVEEVIKILNSELKTKNNEVILIDVGTGSGCIPIAILKNLQTSIEAFAVDISRPALRVAKKNAKKHRVNIQFLPGNLLKPLIHNSKFLLQNSSIIITANLPYLTEQQFQAEPSIQREPKQALVADNNGLALYEELLQQIKLLISNFQVSISTFFEIDPSQTTKILSLIKNILPKVQIEIKKDLAGLDRLVIINT